MKSSIRFRKPNASITCTNVSTTHASGEANSAFNSLRAIVSIIVAVSRARACEQRGSCFFFLAREAAKDVFETGLTRRHLAESPCVLACPPHQFVGRIGAVSKGHSKNAVRGRLDTLDACNGRKFANRGRMLETEQDGAAALELIQRCDRIVEDGGSVMQDL